MIVDEHEFLATFDPAVLANGPSAESAPLKRGLVPEVAEIAFGGVDGHRSEARVESGSHLRGGGGRERALKALQVMPEQICQWRVCQTFVRRLPTPRGRSEEKARP